RTIHLIKEYGVKPGVVLNPATPAETVKEVLPYLDMVLLMTVNTGFGGQKFIPEVLPKISYLDELRKTNNYSFEIEIDGGVNKHKDKSRAVLLADVLVAGSDVINQEDREQAVDILHEATKK